jgi:hypothetical protein
LVPAAAVTHEEAMHEGGRAFAFVVRFTGVLQKLAVHQRSSGRIGTLS